MLFFTHRSPICCSSSRVYTVPRGLCGEFITSMRVRGVMAAVSSERWKRHSLALVVRVSASGGGCMGTVTGFSAGHFDVGDVSAVGAIKSVHRACDSFAEAAHLLVEERLKHYDLVARLQMAQEGAEHALVRAGGDGDFGLCVDLAAEGGGVRVRDGLLQARTPARGGVLVAFDAVEGFFCGVEGELGWIVAATGMLLAYSVSLADDDGL